MAKGFLSKFSIFSKDDSNAEELNHANELPLGLVDPNDSSVNVTTDVNDITSGDARTINYSFNEEFRGEEELIEKYVQMSKDPYVSKGISSIIDEIIVYDKEKNAISLSLDKLDKNEMPEKTKKLVQEEFDNLINRLNFNQNGYDDIKDWYIKGKQFFYPVINSDGKSIDKVVQLAQENVKKVNEIKYKSQMASDGTEIKTIASQEKYYIYKLNTQQDNTNGMYGHYESSQNGFKFKEDAIIQIDSGIYDRKNNLIHSELHEALKTYNHLSQSEDAMVIYRMVRAPEKRAFYIDVSGMGKIASEKYLNKFVAKFKTKQTYDVSTGNLRSGSKGIQSIYEDYFIPRKGNQTAEIETLDAAQNLGEISDIEFLKNKLFLAMKIPETRTNPEAQFTIGRATEIERDEFAFNRFIERLRNRYSKYFIQLLRLQLSLKNILTKDEFDKIKNEIFIKWNDNNFFKEIKEQEILNTRLELISNIESLEGNYFTKEYIHKTILGRSEEEYKQFLTDIKEEHISDENDDI